MRGREIRDAGQNQESGEQGSAGQEQDRAKRLGKWKRRLAWGLGVPGCVLAVLIAGDLGYSCHVSAGYRAWNETIEREEDGVREGCREFTLGRGETAILMVHGLGASPDVWRTMAEALAAGGYTCRAMRLPRFATPMDEYRKTSLAQWRAALEGKVLALGEQHRRVFIAGHSMGGALAIDYALDHPDGAAGVVLLAPLVRVSDRRSPVLSARAWFRVSETLLHFTDIVENVFEPDVNDPEACKRMKTERYVPRGVHRGLFALIDAIEDRAGELRTPTFMVLSPHDAVIDTEAAARYFEAAPADPKCLVYMDRACHLLPIDYGWNDLAEKIARFVREREGSGD